MTARAVRVSAVFFACWLLRGGRAELLSYILHAADHPDHRRRVYRGIGAVESLRHDTPLLVTRIITSRLSPSKWREPLRTT